MSLAAPSKSATTRFPETVLSVPWVPSVPSPLLPLLFDDELGGGKQIGNDDGLGTELVLVASPVAGKDEDAGAADRFAKGDVVLVVPDGP